jgi:hypothetical protein
MSSIKILVVFRNSNPPYKQFFVVDTNTSVGELRKKISDSLQINPSKLLLYDGLVSKEFLVFDADIVSQQSKLMKINIDGKEENVIALDAVLSDQPLPSLDRNSDKFYLPFSNVIDEKGNIKSGFSAVPIPSSLLASSPTTSSPTTSSPTTSPPLFVNSIMASSNSGNDSSYTTYIMTIIILVLCILAYRWYKK